MSLVKEDVVVIIQLAKHEKNITFKSYFLVHSVLY